MSCGGMSLDTIICTREGGKGAASHGEMCRIFSMVFNGASFLGPLCRARNIKIQRICAVSFICRYVHAYPTMPPKRRMFSQLKKPFCFARCSIFETATYWTVKSLLHISHHVPYHSVLHFLSSFADI